MRRKQTKKVGLIVSQEAIEDFARLTSTDRLRWLDEMRAFLVKTLSPEAKRMWDSRKNLLG